MTDERIGWRGWLTLIGVGGVYLYALVARHLPNLLIAPMQADLALSNTEVGVALSLAFALTLGAASVPAGWLADRRDRARLLLAAMMVWSVMTAAAGLAVGMASLLACRLGVALGQAALNPTCYALIAERVPTARLGLAFGLLAVAGHAGIGAAHIVGAGILAALPPAGMALPVAGPLRPWQLTLLLVGAIGVAMSLLTLLLPRQRSAAGHGDAASTAALLAFFRENFASFGLLKLASGFTALALYGIVTWSATLLSRTHGLPLANAGALLGTTFLLAGISGALLGGISADWLHRRRDDGRIVVMAFCVLAAAPLGACAPLQDELTRLLVLLFGAVFFAGAALAINPGATMAMTPRWARGMAASIGVLVVNAIGLGGGPMAVAVLSDRVFAGSNALPLALASTAGTSLLAAALCAWWCSKVYRAAPLEQGRAPLVLRGQEKR